MDRPRATRTVTLALHVMAEEVRVHHGHTSSRQSSLRQTGEWPPQQLGAGQAFPGAQLFPLESDETGISLRDPEVGPQF